MREDDAATEIANSFSECINACVLLCADPSVISRDDILDAVAWFVEAAPLERLPTVQTTSDMSEKIRDGAKVAANIKTAVLAWDGALPPPLSLVSLAHEFLVDIGMEQVIDHYKQRSP